MNDQVPSGPFGLVQDRFEGRPFDRRAQSASSRAAVVHVTAHEGRNPGRPADNDRFVFQPLVPKKLALFGSKHGEIVQIQTRDRSPDLFLTVQKER
jgi:hypothetical protein